MPSPSSETAASAPRWRRPTCVCRSNWRWRGRSVSPTVDLAYRVGGLASTFPAVMNAANEVAVMAFLEGKIPLTRIVEVVQAAVDEHDAAPLVSIVNIERADHWARQRAAEIIEER